MADKKIKFKFRGVEVDLNAYAIDITNQVDIVKLPSGRNRTIYFENGCFGFNSCEGSFFDVGEVDFITFGGKHSYVKRIVSMSKVIGNRNENPELIK